MEDIYLMDYHDMIILPDANIQILRVPGGWIYTISVFHGEASSVFVPYKLIVLESK